MSYIGQRPVVGRYIKLDQISSGFNGSNTGFSMTAGSQAVFPGTARNLLLSLGGVIQEPDTDFTISGSTLTFTTPPVANTTFFGVIYGDMQATGTPSDGTVLPASIASSGHFKIPQLTINEDGADVDFRVEGDTDANLLFVDASTDRVGIGTSSPNYKLVVQGSGVQTILAGSTNAAGATLILDGDSNGDGSGSDYASITHNSAGNIEINNRKSGAIIFKNTSSETERMRINSSGNVGIGTSSPHANLHIQGGNSSSSPAEINVWGGTLGRSKFNLVATETGTTTGTFQLTTESTVPSVPQLITVQNSGNVGIGTSAPTGLLHIKNDSGTSEAILKIESESGQDAMLFIDTSDGSGANADVRFARDGSTKGRISFLNAGSDQGHMRFTSGSDGEAMRLDSSGRLLIGHTANRTINSHTPRLQIQGTDYSSSTVSIINNANSVNGAYLFFIKQRSGSPGGTTIAQNGDIIGQLRFSYADGVDIEHPAAYIEAKVDGTPGANSTPARVSIYTNGASTGPSERVRIEPTGALTFVGASTRAGNTNSICSNNNNSIDVNVTEYFYLRHGNGTEILRARSTGNVSIGTTNTTHRFTAQNTNATQITGFFLSESTSYSVSTLQSNCSRNTSNGSYTHFKCAVNGVADKFRVLDSGAIQSTSNSIGGISDERLKENIVDAGSQWDDIKNIRVRKFNFKKLTDPEQKTMLGVVAQEAETVCPGLVESTVQLQEGVEQEYKSFKYSILYMKAIKALQEAMARIEVLETEVAALKAA